MAKPSIVIALLLIALGVYAYVQPPFKDEKGQDKNKSITRLIPSVVGAPILLCGILALNPSRRKHSMHVAVTIGLLGLLAAIGRLPTTYKPLAQTSGEHEIAKTEFAQQMLWKMAFLCLLFVLLCVRSFIAARKEMKEG